MEDPSGSRDWYRVESLEAAQFITNRDELRYLKPFLLQERTVSEAAAELSLSLTAMYKKVERLVQASLIEVSRQTPRAGRALKHYRAVSSHFFVPFKLYPPELIGEHNRQHYLEVFERNIQRLYRSERFVEQDWGVCTDFTEAGELYLSITVGSGEPWDYLHPQAPAILSGWNPLHLNFEDAKALQQELFAVVNKYLNKQGPQTYLIGLFLTEMPLE